MTPTVPHTAAPLRRFLVSRTTTAPELLVWPPGVDLVDERGWVDHRAEHMPAPLRPIAYPLAQVLFGLKLLWRARGYDAIAVGRYANFYVLFASLLGLLPPTVQMDVERRYVRSSLLDRRIARAAARVGCFTHSEMAGFAASCGVPEHKFRFLPYCAQDRDLRSRVTDGGYILSAGLQARDWTTFLAAAGGLPYPVHILTDQHFDSLPPNCSARFASRQEYFDQMAGCSCLAVALHPEPYRVTGMMTFVTALAMGKPVVLAGPAAGSDYIRNGETGYCLGYGDVDGLRCRLQALMEDDGLRRRMGEAARTYAQRELSTAAFQARVLALLHEAARERAGKT